MSRVKDLYIAAHEAEMAEYLDAHPDADEHEAYEATADSAHDRMSDRMASAIDHYRHLRKDGML